MVADSSLLTASPGLDLADQVVIGFYDGCTNAGVRALSGLEAEPSRDWKKSVHSIGAPGLRELVDLDPIQVVSFHPSGKPPQVSLISFRAAVPLGKENDYAAAFLNLLVSSRHNVHRPHILAFSLKLQIQQEGNSSVMALSLNGAIMPEALATAEALDGSTIIRDVFTATLVHMVVASKLPAVLVVVAGEREPSPAAGQGSQPVDALGHALAQALGLCYRPSLGDQYRVGQQRSMGLRFDDGGGQLMYT